MKKILTPLLIATSLFVFGQKKALVCDPSKEANYKSLSKQNESGGYGAVIEKKGAVSLSEVDKKMKKENLAEVANVLVKGKVKEVCQKKGCWMMIDDGAGNDVRVRFEDYAFFVPMNISGWTVYAQGTAFYDTTTVAMLKHYAEDAKKSKAEIDNITKPLVSLNFTATGVLFDKKK